MPNEKKTKFDVIIIGAGPSGYTAGIYCSRARHDTLILIRHTSRGSASEYYRGRKLSRF